MYILNFILQFILWLFGVFAEWCLIRMTVLFYRDYKDDKKTFGLFILTVGTLFILVGIPLVKAVIDFIQFLLQLPAV